jgi:transcriptional regulator GlxA family with amidase domain
MREIARAGGRRVGLLAFDGVMLLDLSGPAEVFVAANRLVPNSYDLDVLTASGRGFATSIGASMDAVPVAGSGSYDTVLVVGSAVPAARFVTPELVTAALDLSGRTRRLGSVCTGAFVLGEAGLLDGRVATTHWKYTRELAYRYPAVSVRHDAIYVRDGSTYSSAGASAGIDLALALVEEDLGPAAAHEVGRDLVVYLQRGGEQSQFSPSAVGRVAGSQVLRRLTDHVRANPQLPHTVRSMAAYANVSERQLARRFRDELDNTPATFVADLRFAIACERLRAGMTVTEAAEAAGFSSGEMMRRSFVARLGMSPRAYRNEYGAVRRTVGRSAAPAGEVDVA